jgi:hypothetical protein
LTFIVWVELCGDLYDWMMVFFLLECMIGGWDLHDGNLKAFRFRELMALAGSNGFQVVFLDLCQW